MNTINYNIKIENEKFGTLMNETFIDRTEMCETQVFQSKKLKF